MIDGVSRLGVHGDGRVQAAAGLLEAAELEQELTLEGAIDTDVTGRLQRAAHEKERSLQVVAVEDRLGLEVVDLALRRAVEARQLLAAGEQLVAQRGGLLELEEVLDQQLGAIEVRRHELGVRADGALELVHRLVDLAFVPEDLAAAVVRLRAVRMRAQRLFEPSQGLIGASTVRGFHRLVEAIPIPIVVRHAAELRRAGAAAPALAESE